MTGKVGAPYGNSNSSKGRPWKAAIDRALKKRSKVDESEALDELAEKLLVAAELGESWALKELGDRFDGKPAQQITLSGDEDNPLTVIGSVKLVKPS